jgi:polyisoprenoid-binding protein YceI
MKKSTHAKNLPARYVKYALGAVIVCLMGFSGILPVGNIYKAASSGDADIKVLGTSNLHNWTMEAKDIACSASFDFLPGNSSEPKSLTALNLSVPVHNLKSGESSMDSRAYSALKASKFNSIAFVLTSATIVPSAKNQFQVKALGNLSIAGVSKPVSMEVNGLVNPDGTITCTGSEKVKMTDYQIKPPTFMLGALKTGDALTINFTVVFKK